MEKYGRAGHATDVNIIWRMYFVCWIPKATNTHSEYAIFFAFPCQQWLRERACVATYVRCLFIHADGQTDTKKLKVAFAILRTCLKIVTIYLKSVS
jgi:hypothetical protein